MLNRLSASWVRWLSHRGLPPDHVARVLELDRADVAEVLARNSRPPAGPWTRRRRPGSYFSGIQGTRARRMAALGYPADVVAPALHLDLEAVRAFLAPRTPDPGRHIKGVLAHGVRLRHSVGWTAEAIAEGLHIDVDAVRAFLAPPPPRPAPARRTPGPIDPARLVPRQAHRRRRRDGILNRPRSPREQAALREWLPARADVDQDLVMPGVLDQVEDTGPPVAWSEPEGANRSRRGNADQLARDRVMLELPAPPDVGPPATPQPQPVAWSEPEGTDLRGRGNADQRERDRVMLELPAPPAVGPPAIAGPTAWKEKSRGPGH